MICKVMLLFLFILVRAYSNVVLFHGSLFKGRRLLVRNELRHRVLYEGDSRGEGAKSRTYGI